MSQPADTAEIPAGRLSAAELQALLDTALANKNRPNGITDDQLRRLFVVAGRPHLDPEYLKILDEGIAEYRREIQEELERDLAEEEGK